jgi:hypothetical protein
VRTKDELLALIQDAVMGEVVLPPGEPMPADWREAMALIATRTRDAMLRHPWVTGIGDGPSVGPNGVRHFDQSLQALAGLDQPFAVKLDILMLVDEYVFGYCSQLIDEPSHDDLQDLQAYVSQLVGDGSYPQVAAAIDALGLETLWQTVEGNLNDPSRFERNLKRLIDGIEASLPPATMGG